MSATRLITATAAVAALAATGVAGAAEAPAVSQQHFIAGAAPLTIPGTGIHKGDWMGSRARLLYRDVTLEGDQRARLTLRAPDGLKVRALAVHGGPGSRLGVVTETRRYPGKQQVTVRTWVAERGAGEVTGRIYALAK